jgi:low affinity Fe/Cu permease
MPTMGTQRMPSEVDGHVSLFDRFAGAATTFVSRGPFFALCLGLVLVWAPSYFIFRSVDTWQLVINTVTTIVTFLLVALLQNSQTRADAALQHKLNAIATALAQVMEAVDPGDRAARDELRQAVGLEDREGS